jgi:hypothetical protein
MVTAFLLAGLPARPFWNSSLLGPRFLASAFTAGPAFMILLLGFIRNETEYPIDQTTFSKLAMVTTVAAQINLVMLGSEIFKEFYFPTHHSISAEYLFFGLDGHDALVNWIRIAAGPAAGVPGPVRRHLDGEGPGSRHPRLRPVASRRDRRVLANMGRVFGDGGYLGDGPLRAHRARAGGTAHRARQLAESPSHARTAHLSEPA